MSTEPFHDRSVVADLLTVCQGEGWLSPTVQTKVQIMIEQGLHPEQALIGTGIVSVEQYGEALSRVFDVPFVRRTAVSSRHATLIDEQTCMHARAFVAERDPSSALVAFADPSDQQALQLIDRALQKKGISLVPAVTLWSDLRAQHAKPSPSAASLRRALQHTLAQSGASACEIGHVDTQWYAHHQGLFEHDTAWQRTHASTGISALAIHLAKHALPGWRTETTATSHGAVVRFEREDPHAEGVHPLDWSQPMQQMMSKRRGILIIIRADKTAEALVLHRFPKAEAGVQWRAPTEQPHVYRMQKEDQREEVLHAALSGRPAIVLQENDGLEWARSVASLGVPVSCLERCATREGAAWISHSL